MKRFGLVLIGTILITSCIYAEETKGVKTEEKVMATVNGVNINESDFNEELSGIPEAYRKMVSANKGKFLDDLVLQELLSQEAKKQGLDKDPEIVKSIERIKTKLLAKKLIEKQIVDSAKVTDDDVKKYYDEHKSEFMDPEQLQASHILIRVKDPANEAEDKAAKEKAEELLKKVQGGGDFAAIAKESSDCPSSAKGGDLGFFSKGQMVPEFEKAAFELKKGEISGVVKTKFGYHIIKVTDKKEARQMTLDEVKDQIKDQLMREKQKTAFDDYTNNLKSKATIKINEETTSETK
jgi:peptidyl-prolyl cis-trans isomerase C